MTRAYVVTLRDGRAAPCEGTLYATPLVPLARELARLDLDAVSVAEEQHTRAEWLAAHEERMAYRCHACGAPDEGAPLLPEEQHLVDEMLREATT